MEPVISQRKLENFHATSSATIKFGGSNEQISKEIYAKLGCNVLDIIAQMYDEQKEHNYANPQANYVKHRQVVAEWMVDVCDYFNLHPTTTHMSVHYLDRIQPNDKYSRFEWQMIAICCIVIASKYNECEAHVPELAQLEEITHQQIPNATFLSYELWTLKRMGWKLHARTAMNFLNCYMVLGVITPATDRFLRWNMGNMMKGGGKASEAFPIPPYVTTVLVPKYLYTLALSTLTDLRFKSHLSSDVAAGIVYITRRNLCISPVWNRALTVMTGCADPSLFADVIALLDAHSMPAIERILLQEDYLYHVPLPDCKFAQQQQQQQRMPLQEWNGYQSNDINIGEGESQHSDPLNDTISSDEGDEYVMAHSMQQQQEQQQQWQQQQQVASSSTSTVQAAMTADMLAKIDSYMASMSISTVGTGVANSSSSSSRNMPAAPQQPKDQSTLPPAPATAVKTIPADGKGSSSSGISPQSVAVDDGDLAGLNVAGGNNCSSSSGPEDESCDYADCSSGNLSALCSRGGSSDDNSMLMGTTRVGEVS